MSRVAVVSYDVQNIRGQAGGVGAFVTRWARMLRAAGDEVSIVLTRTDWEPTSVDLEWKTRYQSWGIQVIELQSPPPLPTRWPEVPGMRVSEMAAPVLENFDIVYLQDWSNAAFHLLRQRRFRTAPGPVCVTVLHGPSEWELSSNEVYPQLPADLHLAYLEQYAARHSDFVVSPSRYMVDHLTGLGWQFPGPVEVLGLPMPEPPASQSPVVAPRFSRIVYFGRVEQRKGIRLFVRAMQHFGSQHGARPEVVLLGSTRSPELLETARRDLKAAGFSVTHIADRSTAQALDWLREHASDALCVIPSPSDNFPYALVEASLVPGLNVVVCRGGGVPEILPGADKQLFAPHFRDLAEKIAERLAHPLGPQELTHYDCAAAQDRWLGFHRRALAAGRGGARYDTPLLRPSVDVCTTYYNKAKYLPQLVEALERQTTQEFHVIAVDDGSPDEASARTFAEHGERGRRRGWDFFRQDNAFVDAARNRAAARGSGEYILFVDADDVPALNSVERLRDAMALSGDDALICSSFLFASENMPYDAATGSVVAEPFATCVPLGVNPVGALLDPSSLGGSMFMVRRSAFEAIGGFTEKRGAGHEDWELYLRLALAGFKVDVLPETLQFYRQVEGSLARTLPPEASLRRLIGAYEDSLRDTGLGGAALALSGLYQANRRNEERIHLLEAKGNAPERGYAFFSGTTGSFATEGGVVSRGIESLRRWYRNVLPMETRLKIHRTLLAPFLGVYRPPSK